MLLVMYRTNTALFMRRLLSTVFDKELLNQDLRTLCSLEFLTPYHQQDGSPSSPTRLLKQKNKKLELLIANCAVDARLTGGATFMTSKDKITRLETLLFN